MARALVTGSGERVAAVAALLEKEGHDVRTATGPGELDNLSDLGGVTHYIQLPSRVHPVGDSLVGRVRSFLADGLLGRFAVVDQVLPALADGATVVLVSGNTPDTVLPDDRRSRLALLHVLAHATRAELGGRGVTVVVASGDRDDEQIVGYALHGGGDAAARPAADAVTDEQYEDWRIETMGLRSGLA
jgi:hypothetical protein